MSDTRDNPPKINRFENVHAGRDFIAGDQKIINFYDLSSEELLKLLKDYFHKKPSELNLFLSEFHQQQSTIDEWKALHNQLNDIIMLYDTFHNAIFELASDQSNIRSLKRTWININILLEALAEWAKGIRYIGEKFIDDGTYLKGPYWAIKLEDSRRKISKQLECRYSSTDQSFLVEIHSGQGSEKWKEDLLEFSSQCKMYILQNMDYADRNLRQCILELMKTTNEFFVR